MAEDKKKVIVYADWISKFEALEDSEAGKLIKHFFRYINDLNPQYPDRITEISFIDIQNTLKRDLKKWENKAEKSRENGKLGGRPKEPTKTKQVILKPKEPVNDTVIDIVKEREKATSHTPNFFYIGLDRYGVPISKYLQNEHQATLEAWQMQNKEIKIEDIFKIIDKDVGKTFGDYSHPLNYFKSTAKEILKARNFNKQQTSSYNDQSGLL